MIVLAVLAGVFLLIVVGSVIGARRGTSQSFVSSDAETDRARIHYQGNGDTSGGAF